MQSKSITIYLCNSFEKILKIDFKKRERERERERETQRLID